MAAYVPFQLKDQADRRSQWYYMIDNVVWFDGELPRVNEHSNMMFDIIKHNER